MNSEVQLGVSIRYPSENSRGLRPLDPPWLFCAARRTLGGVSTSHPLRYALTPCAAMRRWGMGPVSPDGAYILSITIFRHHSCNRTASNTTCSTGFHTIHKQITRNMWTTKRVTAPRASPRAESCAGPCATPFHTWGVARGPAGCCCTLWSPYLRGPLCNLAPAATTLLISPAPTAAHGDHGRGRGGTSRTI